MVLTITSIIEDYRSQYEPKSRRLIGKKGSVLLAKQQGRVFEIFYNRLNKTVSRDDLMLLLYDYSDNQPFDRSLDVAICRIRQKLEAVESGFRLNTIRSVGYVLRYKDT